MSGNGRAGNGRGNSRRGPFRRRNGDSPQGEESRGGRPSTQENGASGGNAGSKNGGPVRNFAGGQEKKAGGRGAEGQSRQRHGGFPRKGGEETRGEREPFYERPKWSPPKFNTDPLPVCDCPWCGKPIRDISAAIADKETGVPVHFDCVAARLAEGETLEKGDALTYIGGGRFGIVSFGGSGPRPPDRSPGAGRDRDFRIKKIIEWESKDQRAEWRAEICDHYSVT